MTTQWYSEAFDPQALPDGLAAVYDYWLSKRRGGALPGVVNFNLLELPVEVQPYVAVLELTGSPGDNAARFRIVGAKVAELYGLKFIKDPLTEALPTPGANLVHDLVDSLLTGRKPLHIRIANSRVYSTKKLVESLLLPLLQDGSAPAAAIAAFHWQD